VRPRGRGSRGTCCQHTPPGGLQAAPDVGLAGLPAPPAALGCIYCPAATPVATFRQPSPLVLGGVASHRSAYSAASFPASLARLALLGQGPERVDGGLLGFHLALVAAQGLPARPRWRSRAYRWATWLSMQRRWRSVRLTFLPSLATTQPLAASRSRWAARVGCSAEAEHRAILEQALRPETETFAEAAARLRARTPPQATNSADLVRQDRDGDHAAGNP